MGKKTVAAIITSVTLLSTYNSPHAFAQEMSSLNLQEMSSLNRGVEAGKTFTFSFESTEGLTTPYAGGGSFGTGACTGTFANPQVEADDIIGYGISVTCGGTGYLPLDVQIELQEEHLGFYYQTVDRTSMRLHEGYGFVRGEAFCAPDEAGHDYRISATINAGDHRGTGLSDEIHLPCNVG